MAHESPADADAASGDQQETSAQAEHQGREECIAEHAAVKHKGHGVAHGHQEKRWEQPERADYDPENAQGVYMALEAAGSAQACGPGNRLAAFGTDVEVGLQWSPASIAEHFHTPRTAVVAIIKLRTRESISSREAWRGCNLFEAGASYL